MDELFAKHVAHITKEARSIMAREGYSSLIVHAGTPALYHADDQEIPFRSVPHFKRFVPLQSPSHLLCITENATRVVEVIPQDFWEEQGGEDTFWKEAFVVQTVGTAKGAWDSVSIDAHTAFIGDEAGAQEAIARGITATNPEKLITAFDTARSVKTEYEIACIKEANHRVAPGHQKAKDAFLSGASELEIHTAFLTGAQALDRDLPYPTIVALNEKGATLHYQRKRVDVRNGLSFLIDAGVRFRGYASDVTRTYASLKAPKLFADLITALDELQKELVEHVRPGVHFIELHHEAHLGIATLLHERGIITVTGDEAIKSGVTRAFLPHGLGHMLGLQVHDVGNTSAEGLKHPLRELYPKVRTNMKLENNMVTTIEPGIYFNEILLAPHRSGVTSALFNWSLVDSLIPLGGIRIEDNIVVAGAHPINLTRECVP